MSTGERYVPDYQGNDPFAAREFEKLARLFGGGVCCESFPVGGIFISDVSTDPAELLGYGTWELFSRGTVLLGK